jgi:hypothetical protein
MAVLPCGPLEAEHAVELVGDPGHVGRGVPLPTADAADLLRNA